MIAIQTSTKITVTIQSGEKNVVAQVEVAIKTAKNNDIGSHCFQA